MEMDSAWDNAQTRLAQLRTRGWGDGPSPRTIRVGQLDAELLDQELVHLLQEPISKALNSPRWKPELSLFIQLVLYKLSVWNTGATYGAKLQDLRYVVPHSSGQQLSPSGLPHRILLLHGTLTVLVPYLHTRLRAHALSRAWPDAPSSDHRRRAWEWLISLESTHSLAALLSFIAFLWDGRFRTIADRLLNMSLAPSRRLVKRDVSYEFMNRQMVWHAFTEFLLFLLPLVSARSIRRRISRISSLVTPASISSLFLPSRLDAPKHGPPRGKYWSLPRDQCAICAENASFSLNLADPANAFTSLAAPSAAAASSPESTTPGSDAEPPPHPIHTPYLASCGDIYCYACIAERMMRAADEDEEQKWECLRCGQRVESADRLVVEVESVGSEVSGSDYDFSSDMDATDMSSSMASMGSYTYSQSELSEG
ncbi:Pex12 amino terminal region-domain-containing protein [Mycena latifolia]|nr:Pex12 amino terminal region-domain-containing protein [Mycena latifolia]